VRCGEVSVMMDEDVQSKLLSNQGCSTAITGSKLEDMAWQRLKIFLPYHYNSNTCYKVLHSSHSPEYDVRQFSHYCGYSTWYRYQYSWDVHQSICAELTIRTTVRCFPRLD
jgi:hypothetical protein